MTHEGEYSPAQSMKDTPEVRYELVFQDITAERVGGNQISARIQEYETEKDLEFSDRATLLSPREREIMQRTIMGLNSEEIGKELGITYGTVKNHKVSIVQRLREWGLIDYGDVLSVINALLQIGELQLRDRE